VYGQAFDRQHTEHSTFDPSMLGQYTYGQPQLVTRAYYYLLLRLHSHKLGRESETNNVTRRGSQICCRQTQTKWG
jgi:hypothetical protein